MPPESIIPHNYAKLKEMVKFNSYNTVGVNIEGIWVEHILSG
jgi:hypothetical protein